MQVGLGLAIILLGVMHFFDRDRPPQEVRTYFLAAPRSALGRGTLAVSEVLIGFLVLFTA